MDTSSAPGRQPYFVTPAKAGVHTIRRMESAYPRHAQPHRPLGVMDPRFHGGDEQSDRRHRRAPGRCVRAA